MGLTYYLSLQIVVLPLCLILQKKKIITTTIIKTVNSGAAAAYSSSHTVHTLTHTHANTTTRVQEPTGATPAPDIPRHRRPTARYYYYPPHTRTAVHCTTYRKICTSGYTTPRARARADRDVSCCIVSRRVRTTTAAAMSDRSVYTRSSWSWSVRSKYRTPRRPPAVCMARVNGKRTQPGRRHVMSFKNITTILITLLSTSSLSPVTNYDIIKNKIVTIGIFPIRPTGSIIRFSLWSGIIYYYNIKWPNSVR